MNDDGQHANEDREPLTYGQLRRRLEEMGNPWSVDPTISDDELVPQYPTGGQPPEEDDFDAVVRTVGPDTDIRDLIAELPPSNPHLREEWEKLGVPLDRVVEEETSDRPPQARKDEDLKRGERGER